MCNDWVKHAMMIQVTGDLLSYLSASETTCLSELNICNTAADFSNKSINRKKIIVSSIIKTKPASKNWIISS